MKNGLRHSGFLQALFAFVLLAWLSGCGYRVAGRAGAMPGAVQSLSIPIFSNNTGKPDIEGLLTEAFVREFMTAVKVDRDGEAILSGVIKSYDLRAVSYTRGDVNQEYRLTVALTIKMTRKADGLTLWSDDHVTDYEDFTVNIGSVGRTEEAERAALQKLAKDTARTVKERMLVNF